MSHITFLRHAESIFNVDCKSNLRDCSLTTFGILQASTLNGHYDLIIVSPLLRAKQTLLHSNITYDHCIINNLIREFKTDPCDFFEDEEYKLETEDELMDRGNEFINELKRLNSNILVISHCEFIFSITGTSLHNIEKLSIEIV
jgi:broad specificity phosphatase PhoE